jgi:acyl-CoA synthetase (NDP forming)
MVDTLTLMSSGRRAGPGAFASVHDSGGERAMIIDLAARGGVEFADISAATRDRLAAVLEPGLPAVNPLDAWGTGNASEEIYAECIRALLADDAVAALAFSVDLTTEDDPSTGYIEIAKAVWPETGKPMAMLSNLASAVDRGDVRRLAEAGVPVLEGTVTGLAAFRHLFEYRDVRSRPPLVAAEAVARVDPEVRDRWADRLEGGGAPLSESEGLALLAAYGVPVAESREAASVDDAMAAANALGWPVAVKTAAPRVTHKSDAGGVRLGLGDEEGLRAAYADLSDQLGPEVLVQAMAPPGVEMHVGLVHDEQFGPLVLVAAGGVLVELLGDRRLALPPVDEARARSLIDRLRTRPLLDGVRGAPAADVGALARVVVAFSALASDLGDRLAAVDANPVVCGPDGCLAVDALVVPRSA